jgi:outer membrane protein OmpA-like peptidoglycan-associated protein
MRPLLIISFLFYFSLFSIAQKPEVQWASSVLSFSSEFYYANYPTQYKANQVLGSPSCEINSGSSPAAWSTAFENQGKAEYIEVSFDNPMKIQQVLIHENFNAGSITDISVRDMNSQLHSIYKKDSVSLVAANGRLLQVFIPQTSYEVQTVRITMNCELVTGFKQIDAIGIANHQQKITSFINTISTTENAPTKERLSESVNSPTDEVSPIISPDGQSLYFTRQNHPQNIKIENQDIWVSSIDKGVFLPATILGSPLNNSENNSLASITPDGNTALVLNVYNADGTMEKGISISRRTDSGWELPKKVEIEDFQNESQYGEYFLLNSGNILLMTVQRKEGIGNKDVHVSFLKEDEKWTKPQNLGPTINTVASEIAPFMASDNRTLYYATSCKPGYGKADIFMSRRIGDGWDTWSEPVNMGSAINSSGFDAYYTLPASGEFAYFVSYAAGNNGDLYRIPIPKELRPLPVTLVQGKVLNSKTKEPIGTGIAYYSLSGGTKEGTAFSDATTGEYKIVLPSGQQYGFSASKDGFLPVSSSLDLKKSDKYTVVTQDLFLTPIEEGARIRVNNIYFDFDKSILRSESNVELDQIAQILQSNPTIRIRIEGHTDDKGDAAYNVKLSQNRANSVKTYLLSKGVDASRIESIGYGKANPSVPNSSDMNRQLNRRVEFVVIGM